MADPKVYEGNGHRAVIEDPENITLDECRKLTSCGETAWNSWREEFPVRGGWGKPYANNADFQDQDFTSNFFDFSGFDFGDGADFSGARFDHAFFAGSKFGHDAHFIASVFGDRTTFEGAVFGRSAAFDRSSFGDDCSFEYSRFDSYASCICTKFGANLNFSGVVLGDEAVFDWATFGARASFVGTLFVGGAFFEAATFGLECDFSGLMAGDRIIFDSAIFNGHVSFRALSWGALRLKLQHADLNDLLKESASEWSINPWSFQQISFQGVHFAGAADFSGRHFESSTDFGVTRFPTDSPGSGLAGLPKELIGRLTLTSEDRGYISEGRHVVFDVVPDFFQAKLHQDTTFEGAKFPEPYGTDDAQRAYRTLKLAFSQQQDIREEQRFFKLEMEEEAARASGFWRWLYRAYKYTSDFGFNTWLPLKTLILFPALICSALYLFALGIAHPSLQSNGLASQPDLFSKWLQFTVANMVPLPDSGFLKDLRQTLFGSSSLAAFLAFVIEIIQKTLALIGYFLTGLALRNLFKMK